MKNNLFIRCLYYTSILLFLITAYALYLLFYLVVEFPSIITSSSLFILSLISTALFIIETIKIIKRKNVSGIFITITFILLIVSSVSFFFLKTSGILFFSVFYTAYQEKELEAEATIKNTTNDLNNLPSVKLASDEQFIKINSNMIRKDEDINPKNGECLSKAIFHLSEKEKEGFYGRLNIKPQFNDFLIICNIGTVNLGFTMSKESNSLGGSEMYDVWAYNDLESKKIATLPVNNVGFDLLRGTNDYYILIKDYDSKIEVPEIDRPISGHKLFMIDKNNNLELKRVEIENNRIIMCRYMFRETKLDCDDKIYLTEY